jgi:hypothetical protein
MCFILFDFNLMSRIKYDYFIYTHHGKLCEDIHQIMLTLLEL